MTKQLAIAVDVGGTTVDAVGITAGGELVGKVVEGDSHAVDSAKGIVDCLAGAIAAAARQADGCTPSACGIAMPAPFDYEAGVSHMTHKFQSIYGMELGELLRRRTGLPVYFINDADAFGLGVGWRQLPGTNRFVALTIGTGLGGCFMEGGKSALEDGRVPLGGEVWDLPCRDGILEDYVSARGVVALYDKVGGKKGESARAIADLARAGNEQAVQAYQAMGVALGEGLASVFAHFAPEQIVVGGKVGLALDLFEPALKQALADASLPPIPIVQAARGNLALWGAARHAFSRLAG